MSYDFLYIDVHMKTFLIDVFLHAQECSNMLMLVKAILILWVVYMELRWLLILTLFFYFSKETKSQKNQTQLFVCARRSMPKHMFKFGLTPLRSL